MIEPGRGSRQPERWPSLRWRLGRASVPWPPIGGRERAESSTIVLRARHSPPGREALRRRCQETSLCRFGRSSTATLRCRRASRRVGSRYGSTALRGDPVISRSISGHPARGRWRQMGRAASGWVKRSTKGRSLSWRDTLIAALRSDKRQLRLNHVEPSGGGLVSGSVRGARPRKLT
jgi:hypothetical protein